VDIDIASDLLILVLQPGLIIPQTSGDSYLQTGEDDFIVDVSWQT